MRLTDDRYHRDLRRFHLALRLIRHEARTHTIVEWTGLAEERVRNFSRTYGIAETGIMPPRHRGPAPRRLTPFLRTPTLRSEAAAVAGLCRTWGVIPTHALANATRELPGVVRGERLCDAFDFYRACVPDAALTLEQVMLLVVTLARRELLVLGMCTCCRGVNLIDALGAARRLCTHCEPEQRLRRSERQPAQQRRVQTPQQRACQTEAQQAPEREVRKPNQEFEEE